MRTWAWKPSLSTVAQSLINEIGIFVIMLFVRWPPACPNSHPFTTNSCSVSDK